MPHLENKILWFVLTVKFYVQVALSVITGVHYNDAHINLMV